MCDLFGRHAGRDGRPDIRSQPHGTASQGGREEPAVSGSIIFGAPRFPPWSNGLRIITISRLLPRRGKKPRETLRRR
jgi:hypothetical protein